MRASMPGASEWYPLEQKLWLSNQIICYESDQLEQGAHVTIFNLDKADTRWKEEGGGCSKFEGQNN